MSLMPELWAQEKVLQHDPTKCSASDHNTAACFLSLECQRDLATIQWTGISTSCQVNGCYFNFQNPFNFALQILLRVQSNLIVQQCLNKSSTLFSF